MSRIRSIKPEFWTSEQVMECSTNARLLFIGIWNFCDDKGRHPFSAKQCKAEVFPSDNFTDEDVLGMLQELSKNDLIVMYRHENKEYFFVKGWKHQRIDKPQAPKYPDPDDDCSQIIPRIFPPDTIGEDRKGYDLEVRANARNDDYAFAGTVVRLNVKDFDRWQKAYSNLDLLAELTARDVWLASDQATDEDRKKWFLTTSKYLANRNAEAKSKADKSREDEIFPPEIYRGLQ